MVSSELRSRVKSRIQNKLWFKTLSIVVLTTVVVVYTVFQGSVSNVQAFRRLEGGCTIADPPAMAVLYAIGVLYCFVALAILADEMFVPTLDKISQNLGLSEDVAGATLMAAGGSSPELFTSAVATFMGSSAGFGAIVGSAVFNVLFVVGICAILTPGIMQLTSWPLCRDSSYYIVVLVLLAIFFGVTTPGTIEWWEALIIHGMYYVYVLLMSQNEKLRAFFVKPPAKDALMKDPETASPSPSSPSPSTEETPLFRTPSKFRQGVYHLMTSNKPLTQTLATHLVRRMVGDVDAVFSSFDKDGNGHIDISELKGLFTHLGVEASDADVTKAMKEVDVNGNGVIDKEEFVLWYTSSKERLDSEISEFFHSHDTDNSGALDPVELKNLLNTLTSGHYHTPEDLEQFMKDLNPQHKQKISKKEFEDWFLNSELLKEWRENAEEELEDIEGLSLHPPEGPFSSAWIWYLISLPLVFCYYWTIPDVRIVRNQAWQGRAAPYWAFVICLAWMGFFSYWMVGWTETIGATAGIPTVIMGLTFLACGTSVPDMLSAIIVAKKGAGDQAVSSSVGSNIFDICVGLGLPWLLYMIAYGGDVKVGADNLVVSIVTIAACMAAVIIIVSFRGWMLDKYSGYVLVFLYLCFVAEQLGLVKSWNGGC